MKLGGNTILITGGGSGIGLGLALEFLRLGNEVIVAGRSKAKLEAAAAKGLRTVGVDLTNENSVVELAAQVVREYPTLNVVINNAGVMMNEKLSVVENSKIANETITTNVLAPMWLTNALLPHLMKQPSATIMTVTSGLAYVPLALTPSYSASKAAIHAYTQSLRYQLKDTPVEVKELVPPYVRSSLMGERQAADANAMPIEEFVTEVMSLIKDHPEAAEILVKRVLPQRRAGDGGFEKYEEFFKNQNDTLMRVRQKEWDAL